MNRRSATITRNFGYRGTDRFRRRGIHEPWIEPYAFEDVVPLPIMVNLNTTGWAIAKRVFDAYCAMKSDDDENEEVDVNGHLRMLQDERTKDDRGRRTRDDERALQAMRNVAAPQVDTSTTDEAPRRRSARLRSRPNAGLAAVQVTGHNRTQGAPPKVELEHLRDISLLHSLLTGGDSKAGACDGGDGLGSNPGLVAGSYPKEPLTGAGL